jgi:tetratricopeptide (TPR) repeat protein
MQAHQIGRKQDDMKHSTTVYRRRFARTLAALIVATATMIAAPGFLGGSFLGGAAWAQTTEDIEKAKQFFFDGQDAYADEKYTVAAEAFLKAYELSGRAELLYNVGQSYWNARQLKKAEKYFQQYINAMPDAPNVSKVVESIIEIQQEMAAQMANVKVDASQPGVEIFVDQETEARCKTPCTVLLMPGDHNLSARPKVGEPIAKSVTVAAEQQSEVYFELPGRLQVRTDQRSGSVNIAGVGTYALPMDAPISLPPGAHDLTVTGADGAKWSGSIDVRSGKLARILVPMQLAADSSSGGMSTLRTVSFALAGLSVGLAAGGVFMGMQASDTHAALEERQNALGSVDESMVEQGRGAQLSSNILYAASAVSLLAGAGIFTWDLMSEDAGENAEIPASEPAPKPAPTPAPAEDDTLLDING